MFNFIYSAEYIIIHYLDTAVFYGPEQKFIRL